MKKMKKEFLPIIFIMLFILFVGILGNNNKKILRNIATNFDIAQTILYLETGVKFPFLSASANYLQINDNINYKSESSFIPYYLPSIKVPIVGDIVNYISTVSVKNQTSKTYNATELYRSTVLLDIELDSDLPQILLVCSHGTESYAMQEHQDYVESSDARTLNTEYNVIKVAETLAENLNANGVNTIYSEELHDYPSYAGSYTNSRRTIETTLAEYPSIKMVIDLHRDAILTEDGEHLKVLTEINGEDYAQLMFVMGSDDSGLEYANWLDNFAFSLKFQQYINGNYDDLMRSINLKMSRYNQDLGQISFLLECGTSGNTLEEALRSIELFADELTDFIKVTIEENQK